MSTLLMSCNTTVFMAQDIQPKKTNIVFFLADDCTNWDIGCYGSKDSKTPNIDKLASEGIQFNRCYQAAPMSSPTRHNIYTGMYPVKTGAYPNHTQAYSQTKSIVHYLKPMGYRVAFSGKKDILPESVFPFEYLAGGVPDFKVIDKFFGEVKESGIPFALMINSHQPHDPWDKGDPSLFDPNKITLPPNMIDTKETRLAYCKYLAEINYLDSEFGKALELIEKYGFTENTLVVFASEQGNLFPFNKWSLYEAGVKSALIARLPKEIKPGIQSESIVQYSDLLPTFIDIAGGKVPKVLDGKSLMPLFNNPSRKINTYSYSIHTTRGIARGSEFYGIRAIVDKQYRYIWNLTPEAEFKNGVNNQKADKNSRWEINWYPTWEEKAKTDAFAKNIIEKNKKRPGEELYDVINDKWCTNNLAENPKYKKVKDQLRKEILKWMAECGDKGQVTELKAFEHQPGKNKDTED